MAFVPLLSGQGPEAIPPMGLFGLATKMRSIEYARPRRFHEKLEDWRAFIRVLWRKWAAEISPDGLSLIFNPAQA